MEAVSLPSNKRTRRTSARQRTATGQRTTQRQRTSRRTSAAQDVDFFSSLRNTQRGIREDSYGQISRQSQRARNEQRRRPRPKPAHSFEPLQVSLLNEARKPYDLPLLLITIALFVTGLIALLSASYPEAYYDGKSMFGSLYYFVRQMIMGLFGMVVMIGVSCFDYRKYHHWGRVLYVFSAVLLVLVLTPLGTSINKSQRWLFGFQPSELAKLAIILMFASYASRYPKHVRSLKGLAPFGMLLAVYILLLFFEPHMSAAMIMSIIGVAILFVAGMKIWYFVVVGGLGTALALFSYAMLEHIQTRVSIWLDPFSDARGKGWQASQSLIAIGSGGTFGMGLGQSRQKFLYLPEPMNDFIFSVICEEMGFVGAVLVLALFAYFVYRGFSIARRAGDTFGTLIATGITMQFAFQILLNLAVVSGLFPVTGASLPFFSYGGTALVMQLLEVGILLNISRHIPPSKRE